jgi:hypothetical protein
MSTSISATSLVKKRGRDWSEIGQKKRKRKAEILTFRKWGSYDLEFDSSEKLALKSSVHLFRGLISTRCEWAITPVDIPGKVVGWYNA